jgi:hypothetical protein
MVRPNWELSTGTQIAANAFFFTTTVAVLGYAIYVARQERRRWPLYIFAAAGCCVFYETIIDHIGGVTYGERHLLHVYHLWGRQIPLYILGVYFTYFGVAAIWLMRHLDEGITRRTWWRYFTWHVVFCFAFEPIPIHFKLWKYWRANQPLAAFGFPDWWWFANGAMLFNATAIMHLLRKHVISDRECWLLIPLYPMLIMSIHGGSAIPVGLALNSTTNKVAVNIASLATIALSFMLTWIFGKAITRGEAAPEAAPADDVLSESGGRRLAAASS